MIRSCQRDFKVLISLADYLQCFLHVLHRTFIHSDVSNIEPSFGFQMSCKILQHIHPELFVCSFARFGIQKFERVAGLIEILERKAPRNHGIAADLFLDAKAHHEFHPFIEYGIVKVPGTIRFFQPGDHAFKSIVGLSVPGLVHNGGGNYLAACIGIQFHQRTHQIEVFLAERFYIIVAGYCVWVLP